jgi:hypothetical protein
MPDLIVMRLADMVRMHPDQITAQCSECKHDVAVFPSGQKIMRDMADVRLVCNVCRPRPGIGAEPAPGAIEEAFQSQRKN